MDIDATDELAEVFVASLTKWLVCEEDPAFREMEWLDVLLEWEDAFITGWELDAFSIVVVFGLSIEDEEFVETRNPHIFQHRQLRDLRAKPIVLKSA